MLFLYRPRETWMPFARPFQSSQQAAYNRQLQAKFESTRRVPRPIPAPTASDTVAGLKDLAALRQSGALSDAEFEAAKARLLAR
jgi:hypothetical protein